VSQFLSGRVFRSASFPPFPPWPFGGLFFALIGFFLRLLIGFFGRWECYSLSAYLPQPAPFLLVFLSLSFSFSKKGPANGRISFFFPAAEIASPLGFSPHFFLCPEKTEPS